MFFCHFPKCCMAASSHNVWPSWSTRFIISHFQKARQLIQCMNTIAFKCKLDPQLNWENPQHLRFKIITKYNLSSEKSIVAKICITKAETFENYIEFSSHVNCCQETTYYSTLWASHLCFYISPSFEKFLCS